MVFTREKNDTSNQNRERCFLTCEKNDMSNQKPQRCVCSCQQLVCKYRTPALSISEKQPIFGLFLFLRIRVHLPYLESMVKWLIYHDG